MRVAPLDDQLDRAGFSSGVEPFDRYLRAQAGQDMRRKVASCFVMVEEGAVPLAYYTLAATSLVVAGLPASTAKRIPRYPLVPATLIGRLAVDHRHRGRRLGEHMLLDACARALRSEIATFAIVVDVRDEPAAKFYRLYDFVSVDNTGGRLFLPMETVARLFA